VLDKILRGLYLTACLALLGGGVALWLLRPAPSAAAPADIEPEARAVLERVAKTYQALPAYADHGSFKFSLKVNDEVQEQSTSLTLAFVRPDKLCFETDGVRLVSDGEHLVTTRAALKKYMSQEAPKAITPAAVLGGPLGAMLGGSPAAAPVLVVLEMLTGETPVESLTENAESVALEADRELDGKTLKSVLILQPQGSGYRLLIDPATNLIRRLELTIPAEVLKEKAPPGTTLGDPEIAWTSGEIATEPPAAETFAFNPPADYTEVKAAEAAAPAAAERNALVGQPAPDFQFEVIDGTKTKTVTKADLKGKVVLLDFWATWCPPCREELPEIQALAERLAKNANAAKVSVVAVSQDRAEDGNEAVRKLVESTLNELKVPGLLKGPVASVALDPAQSVGDAFGVQGIPTLVLLDPEGVVQAVHVGYKEGIGEELQGDIETLLSGKPLVEPAGE
jgi:thiol-disulfide isomerase/thioredoxin/outer membrane lipoprotein-sorting protein